MKKRVKYLTSICAAGILAAGLAIPGLAIGQSDFTNMPGNKLDGAAKPAAVQMTADGLKVTFNGGEYIGGGPNAGIVYNTPVAANGFSVEFTVTKAAGNYNKNGSGVDSWISLNLLKNKNDYFNTADPKKNLGMVSLIRPTRPSWQFDVFELVSQIGQWSDGYRAGAQVDVAPPSSSGENPCRMKMELKKRGSGLYGYFINGEEIPNAVDFDNDFTTLMDGGKFYFSMGLSCKPFNGNSYAGKIEFVIHSINGSPVKAADVSVTTGSQSQTGTAKGTGSTASQSGTAKATGGTASKPGDTATQGTGTVAGGATDSAGQPQDGDETVTTQNDSATTSAVQAGGDEQKDNDGGNGWVVPVIIAAAAVVLGGAGAALYFFKFRKPQK